jgi:hypothetical protein
MTAVVTPTLGSPTTSAEGRGPPPVVPQASLAAYPKPDRPETVPGAIERLARSRERLRDAMLPSSRKRPAVDRQALREGVGSFAEGLVERLRALPGVTILLEAIEDWWARHPLHSAGVVAAEASRRIAAPIAERRPLTLLLGAVLVGALLALLKPWRWLLRPALFAGLLPALLARGVREVPIEQLLQLVAGFIAPRSTSRDDAHAAAAGRTSTTAGVPPDVPPSPINTSAAPTAVVREEPSAVYR